jgi:hypothetical protein
MVTDLVTVNGTDKRTGKTGIGAVTGWSGTVPDPVVGLLSPSTVGWLLSQGSLRHQTGLRIDRVLSKQGERVVMRD